MGTAERAIEMHTNKAMGGPFIHTKVLDRPVRMHSEILYQNRDFFLKGRINNIKTSKT